MPTEHRSWRFGVLSFTGTGHLIPLIALSQELKTRGHKVTFFERAKIEDRIRNAGLDFVPISTPHHAKRDASRNTHPTIRQGIATLRFNLARVTLDIEHYLEQTPTALTKSGVDALLINEIALSGTTVAQLLDLPYFLISTTVPHHFGWKSSSWITGYRYTTTAASWLQGPLLEVSALRVRGPIRNALDRFRRKAGFGSVRHIANEYPSLAHITQLPECLDLPHKLLPSNFHYTGPWQSSIPRSPIDFPWNQLDGRRVVYLTLGTTRNAQPAILRMIAEACRDLHVQLVISLGNRFDPETFADLPGNPVVTAFAPQIELLKIAALAITHGGPNTAFEALLEGKPMVAIPLAYDQPAIAERLKRLNVAEVLPVMRLSIDRIRCAVVKVLNDPRYREAAERVQSTLRTTRGSKRAVDVIEAELSSYFAQQRCTKCAGLPIGEQNLLQSSSAVASYLQH